MAIAVRCGFLLALLAHIVLLADAKGARGTTPSESPSPSGPPGGTLYTYGGGAIMSHVRVIMVLYGDGTYGATTTSTSAPSIASFYDRLLTQSTMFSVMQQYNTPAVNGTNQVFASGSFVQTVTITPSANNTNATIQDAQVQNELARQIAIGQVPGQVFDEQGFPVNLYSIHFPKEIAVVGPGGSGVGCLDGGYCGYHNAFLTPDGTPIMYAIHPNCEGFPTNCATSFATVCATVAHEVFEAMTNPTPLGDTNTWAAAGQEIADLCTNVIPWTACDGQTYGMQPLFSNDGMRCVFVENACTAVVTPSESRTAAAPPCATLSVHSDRRPAVSGTYHKSDFRNGRWAYLNEAQTYGALYMGAGALGQYGWVFVNSTGATVLKSLCGAQNLWYCPADLFYTADNVNDVLSVMCISDTSTPSPTPSAAPVSGSVAGNLISTGTGFTLTVGGPTTVSGTTFGAMSGSTIVVRASVHANNIVVSVGSTLSLTNTASSVSGTSVQLNGTYALFVNSTNPAVVTVTGHADNNGPLVLYIAPGFSFNQGTQITIIYFGTSTGTFTSVTVLAASSNTATRHTRGATGATVTCGPSSCIATGTGGSSNPSASSSPAAAATTAGNCSDDACRIGVGVGVGVGGGLLLLVAIIVACCCCKGKAAKTAAPQPAAAKKSSEGASSQISKSSSSTPSTSVSSNTLSTLGTTTTPSSSDSLSSLGSSSSDDFDA